MCLGQFNVIDVVFQLRHFLVVVFILMPSAATLPSIGSNYPSIMMGPYFTTLTFQSSVLSHM